MYNIKQFAELIGTTTTTLRNWDKEGKLKPIRLASGHRRYTEEQLEQIKNIHKNERLNIIYCRESSINQKESLIKQEEKLKEFCISNGIIIDKSIKDIGSGLNFKRTGFIDLIDLITNNKVNKLIIYYKDRLVRFGFELFEELSKKYNFEIIVVDNTETNKSKEKEFADDIISIIHYFSMKLYGSRTYKKRIDNIKNELNIIKNEIL